MQPSFSAADLRERLISTGSPIEDDPERRLSTRSGLLAPQGERYYDESPVTANELDYVSAGGRECERRRRADDHLSKQLGHTDPSVTLDIYADLYEAREKAEASRKLLEASGYSGLV